MEELEKKMGIKIEAVRDMMLDRFSGVDQKLTAIEQLLKKLIEPQNQTGNATQGGTEFGKNQVEGKRVVIEGDGGSLHEFGPNKPLQAQISSDSENQETGNPHEKMCYLTDENMGEEGIELGKNQDEGKKVATEGGDSGPSHESGPNKPLQAQISSVGEDQETGNPPEKRLNLPDKNTGEEGTECSKNKGNKVKTCETGPKNVEIGEFGPKNVEIGGDDEFGLKKSSRAEISSDDVDHETNNQIQDPLRGPCFNYRGRYGPPWEAGGSCGWVGLYTHQYGTYNQHGPNYSFGKGFCGSAWVGLQETGFGQKKGPDFWSHEFTFKDQVVNSFVDGCPKTQLETGPERFGSKVVNADLTEKGFNFGGQDDIFKNSDVLLQDSLKPDLWAKKDSGPLGKASQNETSYDSGSVDCNKDLGWSTLVEAKTYHKYGEKMKAGSKPEGSNEGGLKTRRCRRKVNKADVTGCVGNKFENYTEKGVKRTNQDIIFKGSLMSNRLGTKDSWTGLSGEKIVKTGQDGIFKIFKSDQWGTKKSRIGSWNKWSKDSSKPDQWPKKDSGLFGKEVRVETEKNSEYGSAECDKGLDWSKLVEAKTDSQHGWGLKRKHPDSSLGGLDDCPISSGPFTASERRVDTFTTGAWGQKVATGNDGPAWGAKKTQNESGSGSGWDQKKDPVSVSDGSTEKGQEDGEQKPGSWGWNRKAEQKPDQGGSWKKKENWGPKRDRPARPVGGPNDAPRPMVPLTVTKQRLDLFTSDEQEILNVIEPIMQSIRRIMSPIGYNDGDPLSADDQTYILDNIFAHHPDKTQKAGAGIDYIMVTKNTQWQDSRCFFVVSTDGRKEDFSYRKCLDNFIRSKFPDKVDEFIPKYFKRNQPRPPMNRDEAGTPRTPGSRPGWGRDSNMAGDDSATPAPEEGWTPATAGWKKEGSTGPEEGGTGWKKETSGASASGWDQAGDSGSAKKSGWGS